MPREFIKTTTDTGTIRPGLFDFLFKKKEIPKIDFSNILPPPPTKPKKYKIFSILLEEAEIWHNLGEKDLEKKTFLIISEKAKEFALKIDL